jgi:hypothetical protein
MVGKKAGGRFGATGNKAARVAVTKTTQAPATKSARATKRIPAGSPSYEGSSAQARISTMLDEIKTKNDDLEQRAKILLSKLG